MNAIPPVVFGLGAFAMVCVLAGALTARAFWAEDLVRANDLRNVWDRTEKSLNATIAIQKTHIELLQRSAQR